MYKKIITFLFILVFNILPVFAGQEDYATITPNASIEEMVDTMHNVYAEKNYKKLHNTSMICIMFYPEEFWGYYYEGVALYELQDYENSINYFTTAIKIAKKQHSKYLATTYINRAMPYHALGQIKNETKDLYSAYKTMGSNYSPEDKTMVLNALKKLKQANEQIYNTVIQEYNKENP